MHISIRLNATPDVNDLPVSILTNWMVAGTRDALYFCGVASDTGKIRRSTQITSIDKLTCKGITTSGRVYELVGPAMDKEARECLAKALFDGEDMTDSVGFITRMSGMKN